MIELKKICKSYLFRNHQIPVLRDITCQVPTGKTLCVCGRSGSGKTTLLNIIGGMLTPTSGRLLVDDVDITELPGHFLSAYRREKVGFIFQQFNLLNRYTVMENLLFPILPDGKISHTQKERLQELLEHFGIIHRADFPVELLSGGEQQRVAIARALVHEPSIIIADEPFSNIDDSNAAIVMNALVELKEQGKSIVVSSLHSTSEAMKELADITLRVDAE